MSNTSNNWKKIGGINRSADHNIVRTPIAVNNSLNVTDTIGTTNSDTNLYGNLNIYGNLDVSGSVSYHTIDFSGNITCDNLDVSGTITCDTLDVSGTITCSVGNNSALAVSVYLPNDPANIVRQNLVNVDFNSITQIPSGSQTIIQCRYTLNVVGTNGNIVAYASGNFSWNPYRVGNSPFDYINQPLNDPAFAIPSYTGITAWNTAVGAVNPIYDGLAYLYFEWDFDEPTPYFTLYTIKDPAVLSQNTQYTFNLEILNCGGSVYNLPAPAPADWNTTITPNVSTIVPYTPPTPIT